jgi:hypothetical protein
MLAYAQIPNTPAICATISMFTAETELTTRIEMLSALLIASHSNCPLEVLGEPVRSAIQSAFGASDLPSVHAAVSVVLAHSPQPLSVADFDFSLAVDAAVARINAATTTTGVALTPEDFHAIGLAMEIFGRVFTSVTGMEEMMRPHVRAVTTTLAPLVLQVVTLSWYGPCH